ncbi:DUF6597 domain-containing transcriptional factor [Bacteroides xylanisolvens]|uniref:DUF6597 domain-containing transcriptional factor n=1 Tax=Bacteroides xylanisolvens TaxID=371601 RepID=UPI0039B41A73
MNNYTKRVIPIGCMRFVFHMGTPPFSTLTNDYQPITFVEGHMTSYSNLTYHSHCKQVIVVFTFQGAHVFFYISILEFYNSSKSQTRAIKNRYKNLKQYEN